ncbi:MAG: hypothetical protein KatS3mg003_1768 [Candidatus Nitrosocaldaceae archaeon]|nr:MAG: hypothetical protein KatS3mg003_1768 [Candidatus Nitrosocaldaceae archaeon]
MGMTDFTLGMFVGMAAGMLLTPLMMRWIKRIRTRIRVSRMLKDIKKDKEE